MTTLSDLVTPALVLDRGVLDQNLAMMQARADRLGVVHRPHLKTAKSVAVANRLAGAPGRPVCVSTIEEAAKVLRIGRTTAYALAREWRTTGGRSGLPVLSLGRTLRVPRAALDRLLDPSSRADEAQATVEDRWSSERTRGTMDEPTAQGPRK